MKHVIKHSGSSEAFDPRKVYASVYASCLSVHETTDEAELVAEKVTKQVNEWLTPKTEITVVDLRRVIAQKLRVINPHAGFVYQHHRILW
ncbi:MAG: ATP cone domain-containing protein [Candidatus Saccharimonadales bacterium]